MAKGAARDWHKETAWRRKLRQQAESGQSVRAWCRRHRITETAFYWWRKELLRRDAEGRPATFVPVEVATAPARDDDGAIEIVLAGGRRVRLTGPVAGQTLATVLDVLERRSC